MRGCVRERGPCGLSDWDSNGRGSRRRIAQPCGSQLIHSQGFPFSRANTPLVRAGIVKHLERLRRLFVCDTLKTELHDNESRLLL